MKESSLVILTQKEVNVSVSPDEKSKSNYFGYFVRSKVLEFSI